MEVDGIPARCLKTHRRVPLRSEEQMAMIGRDYGLSDTCGSETLQAPREILDDAIHDASRRGRACVLSSGIDFGRTNDDDFGVANLLCEGLGIGGNHIVEREIDEFRHTGLDEFLARRKIRQKYSFDGCAEFALLRDSRETSPMPLEAVPPFRWA